MLKTKTLRFSLCFVCFCLILVLPACQSTQEEMKSPTSVQTQEQTVQTTSKEDDQKPQKAENMEQKKDKELDETQVAEITQPVIPTGPAIPLTDLAIGARLQDPSWDWPHRAGDNHTNSSATYNDAHMPKEQIKPVVWIIVGQDHYETADNQSHLVLLSEEFLFRHQYSDGKNSWKDSLAREFINSNFAGSFSPKFKAQVSLTLVPNWDLTNDYYHSEDYAWILSKDEYGAGNIASQPTGTVLAYFDLNNSDGGPATEEELKLRRTTTLVGATALAIRFPSRSMYYTNDESISQMENITGNVGSYGKIYGNASNFPYRIAICLSSEGVQVTQATDSNGVHSIVWE